MSTSEFDAVLFDLDGVLIDTETMAAREWVNLLAEHELHFELKEFMALVAGRTHRDIFAWLQREYGWTRPDTFSGELDHRLMAAFGNTPRIEGALETLLALRAAGIPFAIASNSLRSRLHRKLEAAGLAAVVGQHAYDPAHVGGRGKPLPDLYIFSAEQLGVSVARCVVIEDTAFGAEAGVKAGATVWGLMVGGHLHADSEQHLWDIGVTRMLHSHAALREALGLTVQA